MHTNGRGFIQKSSHLGTLRITLAGHLSGSIVEDLPLVFSRNIGVHRRPSAVAERFGAREGGLAKPAERLERLPRHHLGQLDLDKVHAAADIQFGQDALSGVGIADTVVGQ